MASRFSVKSVPGLALILGWTLGCATPDGPRGLEASSDPACLTAEPVAPAALGAALLEDPPLPGVTQPGWPRDFVEPRPSDAAGADAPAEEHHDHAH